MNKKNLLAGLALAAASTTLPAQTFPPPQNVLRCRPRARWRSSRTCCR
ncbi:hypothetical protein HK415_09270 [Ramlibacter sp. B156]|uniref:Uncharacterized protein n=1 Tax=Ramlibacter montanisoli TaxID=2732512 RepID=A0A849KGP5_9BURK|nr:hypothetical protein [Ramlibacter montanisoli]